MEDFGDIDFEKVYLERGLVRDYQGRLDKNKQFYTKWNTDKDGKGRAVSTRQSFSDYAVEKKHAIDLNLAHGLSAGGNALP